MRLNELKYREKFKVVDSIGRIQYAGCKGLCNEYDDNYLCLTVFAGVRYNPHSHTRLDVVQEYIDETGLEISKIK